MASALAYDELDPEKQQFRLVRFGDAYLSLDLTTLDLDQAPPFEALSYVWGVGDAINMIRVNGKDIGVRSNLLSYLWRRQHHQEAGWIFIDAICIKQDDIVERTSPTRLFDQIYRMTSVMKAWLGNETDLDDSSIQMIQTYLDDHAGQVLEEHLDRAESE